MAKQTCIFALSTFDAADKQTESTNLQRGSRVTMRILVGIAICLAPMAAAGAANKAAASAAADPDRYGTASADAGDYRLGGADKIRITVFNEPTLSGEFAVGADGSLSLPLIGSVPAVGKTSSEIAALIQKDLADGYLREPRVAAEVTTYRPFFILGEVKAPGQYPYGNALTVYNAIATAQGFTPRADRKHIFIKKAGADGEKSYSLTPDLRVLPGDTLRIGERYF